MPTYTELPSGKIRVQVRQSGLYRNATFPTKAEARTWGKAVEAQIRQASTGGYIPPPKGATLDDLIDKYTEENAKTQGKTKAATLQMLKRELGKVKLTALNAMVLRDFIDRRIKAGAGGVTIAGDLSFLSAVLKWGRFVRRLDLPHTLPSDERAGLKHRGLDTRSREREREPSDEELRRLYELWQANARQKIDMPTLCKFALATGMRLGEICGLQVEDVDVDRKTVIIRDRKDPQRKLGNDQTVPLLADAWAIVAPLIKDREAGSLFSVRSASVSTAFTRACQALEPPILDLHFHDLRHRATAQFFRMGLDIPRVSVLTGHRTWSMLRRYTVITPEDVHSAIEKTSLATQARPAPRRPKRGEKAEPAASDRRGE